MSAKSGIQLYVEAIQREPLLTADEEKEYARRIIRHNDAEARRKMIQSNLRLVVSVAKRYANRGMALLDLISEGNLGLIQAVDAFNPSMNIRFSTYASWWIKQSIRRAFSDGGGFVRVPSYMYERLSAWQEAYETLAHTLGREPRIDEFAHHMQSSPEQAWAIHWAMQRSWCNTKESLAMQETAPDDKMPTAEEIAARRDDLRHMRILLQELDPRAATILKLRYGLGGEEPMTLNDVGARIGVTRERVRQIEMEALTALQQRLTSAGAAYRKRPRLRNPLATSRLLAAS
jgi:RNA polymerase primary sigma factor